jgi:cbb3-type cytochrome oxidase subunit 3
MTRLSDLAAALGPSQYTQLALLLFVAVFVGVVARHGTKRRAAEHAACAALPLADDAAPKGGAS